MTEHINALRIRLSNERSRLAEAKSAGEIELRKVWIAQVEKEIAREESFILIGDQVTEMTDDELLAELAS